MNWQVNIAIVVVCCRPPTVNHFRNEELRFISFWVRFTSVGFCVSSVSDVAVIASKRRQATRRDERKEMNRNEEMSTIPYLLAKCCKQNKLFRQTIDRNRQINRDGGWWLTERRKDKQNIGIELNKQYVSRTNKTSNEIVNFLSRQPLHVRRTCNCSRTASQEFNWKLLTMLCIMLVHVHCGNWKKLLQKHWSRRRTSNEHAMAESFLLWMCIVQCARIEFNSFFFYFCCCGFCCGYSERQTIENDIWIKYIKSFGCTNSYFTNAPMLGVTSVGNWRIFQFFAVFHRSVLGAPLILTLSVCHVCSSMNVQTEMCLLPSVHGCSFLFHCFSVLFEWYIRNYTYSHSQQNISTADLQMWNATKAKIVCLRHTNDPNKMDIIWGFRQMKNNPKSFVVCISFGRSIFAVSMCARGTMEKIWEKWTMAHWTMHIVCSPSTYNRSDFRNGRW